MWTIAGHSMMGCTFDREPELLAQLVQHVSSCVSVQVGVLAARLFHTTDLCYLLGCLGQCTQAWT